jgi:hypothetical protein
MGTATFYTTNITFIKTSLEIDVASNTLARHTQNTDTALGLLSTDIDMNGKNIFDVDYIYYGDQNINDSYRKGQSGDNLVEERRENDIWEEKAKATP